ncbi:DedA family protein [Cyanobium sp. FACHB-13342]|nr:DedA family protein [Cyanobium sp. FACHB-13342]MBD2422103.1 DedA family protein [Cyanobium sp. FACHB-13342]
MEGLPQLMGQAVEASPAMGYLAVGLVMLLENLIPPIPSEVVMPFAGYLVGQGRLDLVPTVLAGLLGTVLGAWFWYGIGRLIPEPRLAQWVEGQGRWLGIRAEQLARSRDWFQRHGSALVFWGRLVPGVRTLVSVPAGIERMPQGPFLVWTTAGSLVWTLLLTLAGKALGQGYERVQGWLSPWAQGIERGLGLALVAGLLIWAARLLGQSRQAD